MRKQVYKLTISMFSETEGALELAQQMIHDLFAVDAITMISSNIEEADHE